MHAPNPVPQSVYRPYDHLDCAKAVSEFPALTKRLLRTLRETARIRYYVIGGKAYYRWIDLYEFSESCAVDGDR